MTGPRGIGPDAFTTAAVDHLRAQLGDTAVTRVDELVIDVELAGQGTARLRLHNLYWPVRGNPAAVPEALARLGATVAARSIPKPALNTETIVPLVRSDAWVRQTLQSAPTMPVHPLTEHLWTTYALDRGTHLVQLRRVDADLMQLSDNALHQRACENLARRGPPVLQGPPVLHGDGAVRQITLDGDLDAGLLLLSPIWDDLSPVLGGPCLVLPVARGVLLVGIVEDKLRRAGPPAHHEAAHSFPILQVLRRTPEGWVPTKPDTALP